MKRTLTEIHTEARQRGYNDGFNGYPGPDVADIADLITESTNDDMHPAEINQRAANIADEYAAGYANGKATGKPQTQNWRESDGEVRGL